VPTAEVFISIGSNIGDRAANIRNAIKALERVVKIVAVSSLYETEPVEFTEQPWFLNCAVRLETALDPHELIDSLLSIEQEMGRHRQHIKGPRNIDLDILLYGNLVLNDATLTIPHPAMQQRRFVLEPLAEIAPEIIHPVLRRTIRELHDALPIGQQVKITAQ
jgi:2-amino-4-hydroxy-6-hydroxymethyldihydropteridine diphosphokinase